MHRETKVEVLFNWLRDSVVQQGSEELAPFSVAISIGTATTMGSYLTAIHAIKLNLLSELSSSPALQRDLAIKLMKCLVLHAMSDPKGTLEEQVLDSLRTKIGASSRTRPTPLQMHSMLTRVIDAKLAGRARGTRSQLYRELLNFHNQDASAKNRIPIEEMNAIILLDEAGVALQDIVAMAWQAESPQYTALPVSLLNQSFLSPETTLPVQLICNYFASP